jgi:2-oxo-4-hydroxy-4-carboxy--5-ureidoimidazoline (OHCU) decarboxylase
MPFPIQRMQEDAAEESAPALAAFLAEATESKRSARERLVRSIRLEHPDLASALATRIPISPCKLDSDSAPVEPLSRFVMEQLASDSVGARSNPLHS